MADLFQIFYEFRVFQFKFKRFDIYVHTYCMLGMHKHAHKHTLTQMLLNAYIITN